MADAAPAVPARHMKYPYTMGAKIAQFPYKFYYKTNWMARFYVYAVAACLPVFMSISKLSNSPENVAKWEEIRRKEAAERHH